MSTDSVMAGQIVTVEGTFTKDERADAGSAAVVGSFDELYREQFGFVWRTVRRLGIQKDSIDDAVQDVFVVVHRRLTEYDGRAPVKSWIYGIALRVVADHRRAFRRKQSPLVATDAGWEHASQGVIATLVSPPPSELLEQAEAMAFLESLLLELDEDKREVLVLSELEQLSVPEIAACLGANLNTIYSRLRSARQKFEEIFARHKARSPRGRP